MKIITRFWAENNGQDVFRQGCDDNSCPSQVWFEWNDPLGDAMQSITRPDGAVWRFYYDSADLSDPNSIGYGMISRITFPTGGSLSYCYTLGTTPFVWSDYSLIDPITGTIPRTPLISKRVLDPDGGSINCSTGASTFGPHAAEWDYSSGATPPADAFSDLSLSNTAEPLATKINLPDGNYEIYSFLEQSIPTVPPAADRVVIDTYDTHLSGTPRLKRDLQDNLVEAIPQFEFSPPFDWPVSMVTTPMHHAVWLDGQLVDQSYIDLTPLSQYTPNFSSNPMFCSNPSNGTPYDPQPTGCYLLASPASFSLGISTFGTEGPRSTSTQYKWLSDPTNAAAYQAANLIDAVASQTVTESGATSTTTFAFDESAFVASGASVGHLTGTTQVNNSGPSLTTHIAWDQFGMVDHVVDAKGTTTYTNASWDGMHLYPTVVNSPLGSESFSHDPNTGALLSHTDLNGQTTTKTYDNSGRLSAVHNPDLPSGGTYSIALCYPDPNTAIEYRAQTTPLSSPSADGTACPASAADTVITRARVDGLARITDTITDSTPGGATAVSTQYDGLGRVTSISNPYVYASGASLWTTSLYDAASRVYELDEPGGTKKTWKFSGLTTTATDEVWNSIQTTGDMFGRIVSVLEPNITTGTPTIPTTYTYDLDGLRTATQQGNGSESPRTRSFYYDSLSRLLTATNPETGTVAYQYNAAGALCAGDASLPCSKTDARGITTTFNYDALNRLVSKSYSGETGPTTQSSCYLYDADGHSGSYTKGRLVSEWTQAGSCPANVTDVPNPATSWKNALSYDPMGRRKGEAQCAVAPCSTTYSLQYTYDLAGNTTSSTNGLQLTSLPGFGISYGYDPAGRLAKVTSTWSDSAHPPVLFEADQTINGTPAYGPSGLLTAAYLGVPAGATLGNLSDIRSYDNRLRLLSKTVTGVSGPPPSTTVLTITPNPVAQGVAINLYTTCTQCGQGGLNFFIDGNYMGGSGYGPETFTFSTASMALGQHTMYIRYIGDSAHPTIDTNAVTFTVVANTLPTPTITYSFDKSPVPDDQTATVTVHLDTCGSTCGMGYFEVDADVSGGPLWFDQNGNAEAYAAVNGADGTHTLHLYYYGNDTTAPADTTVSFQAVPDNLPIPTITPSFTPNSIPAGERAIFNINSSCDSACGGGHILLNGAYAGGYFFDSTGNTPGLWDTSSLALGTYTVTVLYLGDAANHPTSVDYSFQVVPNNLPQPIVIASASQTTFPAATVPTNTIQMYCGKDSCLPPVRNYPNGSIFIDGNYAGFFQTDLNGTATTSSIPALSVGQHQLVAHFYGDTSWAPVDSAPITLTTQ